MKAWFDFVSLQSVQPLQSNNTLCALDKTGLLYVGGDDATEFLQNQLSNDIHFIDADKAQLSSLSTAKGRMLGIFRVIHIEGGYLLLMPKDILVNIQHHLHKFIIMSKVILADITESFALFSVTTDQQQLIDNETFPAEVNQVLQSDSLISIRLQSTTGRNRYLILNNNAREATQLWQQLSQNLVINDSTNWRLQEIEAGIPSIFPATEEAFVLQMSNLDLINGVSFKKGCYPGQEIVARMHYLGKLKRRMYLAEVSGSQCPRPGDELQSSTSGKTDGSGKVVDAVQVEADRILMLFIAQIDKADANQLVLSNQPHSKIGLRTLPYSFPE